jgi:hypothetical protein
LFAIAAVSADKTPGRPAAAARNFAAVCDEGRFGRAGRYKIKMYLLRRKA